MALGALGDAILSSPLSVAATTIGVVIALTLIRVLANTFHGAKPPVFEGIPWVGGLMKFAGVSLLLEVVVVLLVLVLMWMLKIIGC